MSAEAISKCSCQNCGGHIEFPSEAAGQAITCPHCGAQTLLEIHAEAPPVVIAPPRSNLQSCPDCGNEISIHAPVCPHCGAPVRVTVARAPTIYSRTRTKSESFGAGCFIQIIALIMMPFFFPVGAIVGIVLFIWGHMSARKIICENFGNYLRSRSVRICPACAAHFQ